MERIKALPRGTKLVLASGVLLFFDLFFTWQKLEVDYGRAGSAREALDGWDAWGLLIGLTTMALVALVIIVRATDVELSPDVPWNRIILALSGLLLFLTLVKNLTDANSSWASYVAIVLAALTVVGAYLTRAEERAEPAVETMQLKPAPRRAPPVSTPPAEPERTPVETAGQKW